MKLVLFWLCLCFGVSAFELEVSARSAILMNSETGVILYEKGAKVPSFPASTTKLATALFLLDQKKADLGRVVTASAEALRLKKGKESPPYAFGSDGTSMKLVVGEKVSIEALLHGLFLVSGNDAANVLAEAGSGSIPQFVDEMNRYLAELGCQNTHLVNPHGYHHPHHQTTAFDLALIARRALQVPEIVEVMQKKSYLKPKTNKQEASSLKQMNGLLKPGKHFYAKAIGMKTGYHSAAQNALVAAASDGGRTLIAVLLGCPTSGARYDDARNLFEAAFCEERVDRLLVSHRERYTKAVEGAKGFLSASLQDDLKLSFYPSEERALRAFVQWEVPSLPIRRGQRVGEVRAVDETGAVVVQGELLANEGVEPTFFFALKEKWNTLF